jgi:hypothetical protein
MITSKTEYDEKQNTWACHLTSYDRVIFEALFRVATDEDYVEGEGFVCEELISNINFRMPLFVFIAGEPTKESIDNKMKDALVSLLGEVLLKAPQENINLNDVFDLI